MGKKKITDIEEEKAYYEILDSTSDEATKRAIHYDDYSNEDPSVMIVLKTSELLCHYYFFFELNVDDQDIKKDRLLS
ncbi:hypothetical protein M5K25_000531 [Dendrobium thyrsiflorum]|uniref:Uncharacterized protein n=1 Tax=Dendrobium thyrsiflorum TaxID=117978 RepID=A0ABD0VVY0_DENTH